MGMSAHQRIRRAIAEKKNALAPQTNPETPNAPRQPDINSMSVTELKEYAKTNGINISGLTKKEDIKARIIETLKAKDDEPPVGSNPGGDGKPESEGKSEVGPSANTDSPDQTSGEGAGGHGADGGAA